MQEPLCLPGSSVMRQGGLLLKYLGFFTMFG